MAAQQALHYVRPAIQNYAWGCKGGGPVLTSAKVNGLPVDLNKEYAEAWFGTHTSAPSLLVDGDKATPLSPSLDLPLLKILGIRAPLSIQLHPDSGIAPFLYKQSPLIYKDPCAKPEMVVPITPLLVMMGVKQYDKLRKSIATVPAVAEFLGKEMEATSNSDIRETEVIRVLSKWLSLTSEEARPLVEKVMSQLEKIETSELIPKDVIHHLAKSFPNDVGVLAPIFLNVLRLQPGQGLFVPPNVLHAYIDGDAVEIMNCSDNVIRAGLTPKLRDAELLCKLLFADESGASVNLGQPTKCKYTRIYQPVDRVRDFELTAVDLPPNQKTNLDAFPVTSLLLCTAGSGNISSQNSLKIQPGQCILIPAGAKVEVSTSDSNLTVYRANKNQSASPDSTVASTVAQIVFDQLPKLSGDQLKTKALEAAELLRSIDQYSNEIWFRAAAYYAIGSCLAKAANNDVNTLYSASRWLQKAVHVCNLAGADANDTPVDLPNVPGIKITPSQIKKDATSALATVSSSLKK